MTATIRAIKLTDPTDKAFPTAEFVTVGPALAREWLGFNIGNRNLKRVKIAAFVRDILADRFLITGEAIKFDWDGRLIDGQNRLHAIIEADRSVDLLVVRGLDPESQKVMDTGAKRSAGDALKMSGHTNRPNTLASAIRLLISWDEGILSHAYSKPRDVTHSEVMEFYAEHGDLLDSAAALAGRLYRPTGATPSPLAMTIFLTSLKSPEDSLQFFTELHDLDLGGKGNPKTTLYRRLQSLREENSIPAQQVYFILRAWNAWRAGEVMTQMKDRVSGSPSRIPEPK